MAAPNDPIGRRNVIPDMSAIRPTQRQRLGAASMTALVVTALGYALLFGLNVAAPRIPESALVAFNVPPAEPPPPPAPAPSPSAAPREEGAAAPPNLTSKATPVVAPEPIVRIEIPPPPIPAAITPAEASDTASGAADVPGPGPGSGGIGSGSGSGGAGNGPGGGGGDIPPRHIAGRITDRDYPAAAGAAGIGGTVGVLYVVTVDGRATDCEITQSSGSPLLDATTCRLIEQRFRFKPSRNAQGQPVESMIEQNHNWIIR